MKQDPTSASVRSDCPLIARNAVRALNRARKAPDKDGAIEEFADFVGWLQMYIAREAARKVDIHERTAGTTSPSD